MPVILDKRARRFARSRFWAKSSDSRGDMVQLDVGRYQQGGEHVQTILLRACDARRLGTAMVAQAAKATARKRKRRGLK